MNHRQPPFWKRPRGLVVLGAGAALLLAAGWLAFSRLGPGEAASAEPFNPRPRIDENALIAAHAERPGRAAAPAQPENAIEASADDEPPAPAAESAPGKPGEGRFDPNEIIREAEAAVDEAVEEVEEALEGEDDGK